jgi:Xaa-Pro dipeptidase
MANSLSSAPGKSGASTAPGIAASEFGTRVSRVIDAAKARGLDGLIVWSRGATGADGWADVLYLTNHMTPVTHTADNPGSTSRGYCAFVLSVEGPNVLVTDAYDVDERDVYADVVRITSTVDVETADVARGMNLAGRRVGIAGASSLLYGSYRRIADGLGPETELVASDDILTGLRAIKSPHEIDLLREASRIGCEWMTVMLDACVPGATEGEVVGEGLRYVAEAGGWPFDVAIASGPFSSRYRHRQALPTWNASRVLEAGDLVHLDAWGPMVHGYYCDLARSTVVGRQPTATQARLLEDSIGMIEHLVSAVQPGLPLSELHRMGSEYMTDQAGRDSAWAAFIPFFGHGLGLEVEPPLITKNEEMPVAENMVLALECFMSEGDQGVGFEHVIAVRERGNELLTEAAPARHWLAAA